MHKQDFEDDQADNQSHSDSHSVKQNPDDNHPEHHTQDDIHPNQQPLGDQKNNVIHEVNEKQPTPTADNPKTQKESESDSTKPIASKKSVPVSRPKSQKPKVSVSPSQSDWDELQSKCFVIELTQPVRYKQGDQIETQDSEQYSDLQSKIGESEESDDS